MKTTRLFTLILFAAGSLLASKLLASNSENERQTRQVPEFHGITVSSGIDLYLTQKTTQEVVVEADSDLLEKIITEVEGGILKIYIKQNNWNWNSSDRKVFVSCTKLDLLEASAGSDVESKSMIKAEKFKLSASSGSDVKLGIEADDLEVDSSSGSDIVLLGKSNTIDVSASSGSDIEAGELVSKKCKASASSGSDIEVNVTEELDANASSGGDVAYSGNPSSKNIDESSGGDVYRK
jgi:hypothetical protein